MINERADIMPKLIYDTELINQCAHEYGDQAQIVADAISKMDGILNNLKSGFQGPAATAYEQSCLEVYRPIMKNAQESIEALSQKLKSVASAMSSQVDPDIANLFKL